MKQNLYLRLASIGIRKNRKLYVPYLLSCMGMVAMSFILQSLSYAPSLQEMKGGSSLEWILSLGKIVVMVFSLLFLFYTNSFLVGRRYKEFGLYSILGLDRKGIAKVVMWESLTVSVIGLAGGIALGLVLAKLAELGLVNVVHGEVRYQITIPWRAVGGTAIAYGVIFLLLMLRSLIRVRRSNPLELLRSEQSGEKPPKANWIMAALGILILGYAYYLAVSIQSPLDAMVWFFVAVVLVIIATYMLFLSGSVALCKALQKNKRFYYKKQNFVSVSSMTFRMRRNGAGLASICILSTMVLVMISSTTCLYFGKEEAIRTALPQDNYVSVQLTPEQAEDDNMTEQLGQLLEKTFEGTADSPENLQQYCFSMISGALTGDRMEPDYRSYSLTEDLGTICTVYILEAAAYNRIMGTDLQLQPGEAMYCPDNMTYEEDRLQISDTAWKLTGRLESFPEIYSAKTMLAPALMLVISDQSELQPLYVRDDGTGESMLRSEYYFGYDTDALSDEDSIRLITEQTQAIQNYAEQHWEGSYSYGTGCYALEKSDFFTTYGGMFFLGIILSILFIFGAAVIIYYKQISEGYEDQSRFEIMQKVGMTKKDIRKSINAQVLIVFFAPLLFAGLHLSFAFPIVWKLLLLFGLRNMGYVIRVTIIAYVIFCAFYGIIYKVTARSYYDIVSGSERV